MKLGLTVAALALTGAAAFLSHGALAQTGSGQPPHSLTAPKAPSSVESGRAPRSREYSFESKAASAMGNRPAAPPTSDVKAK